MHRKTRKQRYKKKTLFVESACVRTYCFLVFRRIGEYISIDLSYERRQRGCWSAEPEIHRLVLGSSCVDYLYTQPIIN